MFLTWIVGKEKAANILKKKIIVPEKMTEQIPENVQSSITDELVSQEFKNFKHMFDEDSCTVVIQLSITSLDLLRKKLLYSHFFQFLLGEN